MDLFLTNGHVYPEVDQLKTEAAYKQRKVMYRNLTNVKFEAITDVLGPMTATSTLSTIMSTRRLIYFDWSLASRTTG